MRRVHAAWIGAIATLLVVFTTAFTVDWAPLAGDRITRAISRSLGRSVTIAGPIHIHPGLFGLKGRATGIVIGNPDWARSDEFASIDAAEVTFSWLPLLIGTFEPDIIKIRGVLFELESRPAGSGYEATWQVGSLAPDRTAGEDGALHFQRLPHILLEDAALAVTDAYGQLHDIAVQHFNLRRKGRGAIANAVLGEGNSPVKLTWTISSLEALGTESSEMTLAVESDAGSVSANGTLGFHPVAGFSLRSYWDISALGRFGKNFGLTGLPENMPLSASVRIAGRADAFAVQLDKVESGHSRMHGVLQGRMARQGGLGSAYNLLELTGEIASQHLDPTPVLASLTQATGAGVPAAANEASLVDFLFGPGLVLKLDVNVSALELMLNDTVLKNASGRVMSDARLFRLSGFSGRLGKGTLTLDLVMDRSGTAVQDVALLFSGRDLDLGWLFDGLGMESLLVAPSDFTGELRAGGADVAELLANLSGAVHFAVGHGAMRGAAARGLVFSGVKLPRLDGVPALSLECLASRINFLDGIGVVDGFMMRGAGYDVTGEGYADLGRQLIEMRFTPAHREDQAGPEAAEPVPYTIKGPVNEPRVARAEDESETAVDAPSSRQAGGLSLPPLRGEVAQNNPCLAGIRAARNTAQQTQGATP